MTDLTSDLREAGALEEAAWLQAELLDATGQPIMAVDLRRVITYWNRAAEAMFGWSGAEAIGRRSPELFRRAETPEQAEAVANAMRSGERWTGDYQVSRRDGTVVSVRVTNQPVFDRFGGLAAVIAVCVDLTSRLAEEEARRQLAAIVTSSGDAIFGVTRELLVSSWNAGAEHLFGHSAEDIIGSPVALLAPVGRGVEPVDLGDIVGAVGRHRQLETTLIRKDGSLVEVLLRVSSTDVDRDGFTGFAVIAHDMTEQRSSREALRASERRLAEAQRIAHLGSFEFDPLTGRSVWSDELYRILDLDPHEQPADPLFASMVHPDDRAAVGRAWTQATRQGEPFDVEFRTIDSTQATRHLRARAVPELDDARRVIRVAGTVMDDTERAELELVRRTAEIRFEIGFEQAGIGAVIVDLDGVPVRVNSAVCALLGRPAALLVGRRWGEFTHPDDVPLGQIVLARLATGHDTYHDERRYLRPDGSVVWASVHVTVVREPGGEPAYISAQFEDITWRKGLEQELAHHTLHDALTGLPNRVLLIDRLTQALVKAGKSPGQLAVLFVNVDHLTAVNDSCGVATGDAVLQQLAHRIVEASRPGDTVARYNGDEFAIGCPGVSVLEVEGIAARILANLSAPMDCDGHSLSVTASLGIAVADDAATPETLLRNATMAMHRAKQRGRGRVEQFDKALREKSEALALTRTALAQGVERGEFVVHYQPVIDLTTGAIVSAEALLRWDRPGIGLVSPDSFIPLAEESGLIIPIGAWVLEQACEQLAQWQRTHPCMSVAVNLSVRQVSAPDIVEQVQRVLLRTGVRPGTVCLELTESLFMDDVEHFGTILSALRALGVKLAIDDFGTGYSSLSRLKRFPVDAVKVDRSFVDGLGIDPHDSALVAAIIAMAHALDLEVTAEGVETQDQLATLRDLRCQRAQGYHLGRPMTATELRTLVADAGMVPRSPTGAPWCSPARASGHGRG